MATASTSAANSVVDVPGELDIILFEGTFNLCVAIAPVNFLDYLIMKALVISHYFL